MGRPEDSQSQVKYYSGVVWLLLSSYDKGYTPTQYLLDSIKPKIETDLPIQVYDSTLFDLQVVSGFKSYFDLFLNGSAIFEQALIVLSYTNPKNVVRDRYLAGLAKEYTCWDTAYISCEAPLRAQEFDFIITADKLPEELTKVIKNGN